MKSRSAEALPDPEPVADPNPEADAHYGYYGYGENDKIIVKIVEDYNVKTYSIPGGWHSPYYGYAWPYYHGYYWG